MPSDNTHWAHQAPVEKTQLSSAADAAPCSPVFRRSKGRSSRGDTLVEFALVLPIFFLLVFGVLDYGHLFFVQMAVQNAVRQAGRFAVTGNKLPDPKNPSKTLSRVDSIIKTVQDSAPGVNITGVQVSSKNGGAGSAGGPQDTVTITVTNDLQLLTPIISRFFGPDGKYTFTVSVNFKNEPFPPGNTN